MLNYIQAEFYKAFHRKYTYIALGIFLLLEGLLVAADVFHNAHGAATYFGQDIIIITEFGAIGFCVCIFTADIVFAGQYKNSTLKNEVSFGLSRTHIYLGKLISQTLLSVFYLVMMMGFFLAASAIFLPHSMDIHYNDPFALAIVGYYLACGLPLWIGAQAAVCMCLFLISSDMVAASVYVAIIFLLHSVVSVIGLFAGGRVGGVLLKICELFPAPMLETAKALVGSLPFLGKAWLVGLFWAAAYTAIGLYGFHRKELK